MVTCLRKPMTHGLKVILSPPLRPGSAKVCYQQKQLPG